MNNNYEDLKATISSIGPFSDELISGDMKGAAARLSELTSLNAVRLILAATRRND
jgi:hypothetical protein